MLSNRVRSALSIGILLVFVIFIQSYVGWTRLLAPWQKIALPLLLLIMSQVLFSYAIRAQRLYDYFRQEMTGRFLLAFKLMLQHNLANNFLPMRSGEVAFPLLMSRYFGISLSRSMPALLWFRIFDLHTLMLLGLWAIGSEWLDLTLLGILVIIWLTLPWALYMANHWLLARIDPNSPSRLWSLMRKILDGAPKEKRVLLKTWFWTLLNWLVKLSAFAWLLALFAELNVPQAMLGVIGGELTSVLPVHGIAGAGTYEAGIVAALMPSGITAEAALGAAVNLHLFLLGVTLIGGAVSLLFRNRHVA